MPPSVIEKFAATHCAGNYFVEMFGIVAVAIDFLILGEMEYRSGDWRSMNKIYLVPGAG